MGAPFHMRYLAASLAYKGKQQWNRSSNQSLVSERVGNYQYQIKAYGLLFKQSDPVSIADFQCGLWTISINISQELARNAEMFLLYSDLLDQKLPVWPRNRQFYRHLSHDLDVCRPGNPCYPEESENGEKHQNAAVRLEFPPGFATIT